MATTTPSRHVEIPMLGDGQDCSASVAPAVPQNRWEVSHLLQNSAMRVWNAGAQKPAWSSSSAPELSRRAPLLAAQHREMPVEGPDTQPETVAQGRGNGIGQRDPLIRE